MRKYSCFHEDESKNICLKVRTYQPQNPVPLSITAYQGENNVIEVCLTKAQAQELIAELTEIVNNS